MLLRKDLYLSWCVLAVVLALSGCASSVFPDFDDDSEIIVDDGGRVEVRKVNEDGVLVADKANAAYDDEDDDDDDDDDTEDMQSNMPETKKDVVEHITPAKVIEVKSDEIAPIKDNVKFVEAKAEPEIVSEAVSENNEPAGPTMHYLAYTVYFENGGATVDASYNANLKKIAKLVKDNDAMVTVYGFASSRTRDTDPASHKLANFKVSAERAENTAKALRRAGVPADKISVQALSDTAPVYQEIMPEGERLNRRAEIYLTY